MFIGETITERLGTALRRPLHTPIDYEGNTTSKPLSINVIHTEPEATGSALRAAESFARGLESTIHLRALVCVPRQLSLADPPVSISYVSQLLGRVVRRFGSTSCAHQVHIHLCRSRVETLSRILEPASLVVIGGRRRLWATAESRLLKAMCAEGHSVAFFDQRTGQQAMGW